MSHNLAALPVEMRREIEQDKKRWHRAWLMIRRHHPQWIRQWLSGIEDQDEKEDWRHRLNTLRNSKARGR